MDELKNLMKQAKRNKKEAQYELGMMYLNGEQLDQDALTAEKWLKQAAKRKHPDALYQMGLIKLESDEFEIALSYFRRALKQKFLKAAKFLGYMYRGDYDPGLADLTEAQNMFVIYYEFDKFDGLEPLLSVYSDTVFKSVKQVEAFLQEAIDFGLIKGKYHLALLKLKKPNEQNFEKAVKLLEDFFESTADAWAARELYYLYSPKEDRYKHFRKKSGDKAQMYLKHAIEKDGALDGTEFLSESEVYLNQLFIPADVFIEKTIARMKTSLSIDPDFAESITPEMFDARIAFIAKPVIDFEAKYTYKTKTIEKETTEKEVKKKQTVRKGFKKTGTVRIPTTVKKTKKRKHYADGEKQIIQNENIIKLRPTHHRIHSLKKLVEQVNSHRFVMDFPKVPGKNEIKKDAQTRADELFEKPKRTKKVKRDISFTYAYVIEPIMSLHYTYRKQNYAVDVSLAEKKNIDLVPFPLDKGFKRELRRFESRRSFMKQLHYLMTLLWLLLIPTATLFLYHSHLNSIKFIESMHDMFVYHGTGAALAAMLGLFVHFKLKPRFITSETYIKLYDDANVEEFDYLKSKNRKAMLFRLLIALLIGGGIFYLFLNI